MATRALRIDWGAGLIAQHYSRLVIDANRPRHSPQLAPEVSDESSIPFNQNLSNEELDDRWNLIHQPYHNRISEILDSRAGKPTVFIAIHSFTPKLRGKPYRDTIIDLMVREDKTLAKTVKSEIHRSLPQVSIGINQVFQITEHDRLHPSAPCGITQAASCFNRNQK